jgi:hypothetical protein
LICQCIGFEQSRYLKHISRFELLVNIFVLPIELLAREFVERGCTMRTWRDATILSKVVDVACFSS